jgi:hypothetical protein
VDVTFNGIRKTLIQPGRSIPCVAQFWDSRPWGLLTLHRRSQTAADDHWLGDFEVLGVAPAPENVNVSVLCVVADGRIFLCARNNHSNEFLAIQRRK